MISWERSRDHLNQRMMMEAILYGFVSLLILIFPNNPDFILPNNPVLTFNENQSLSQPAGSDECTRSFTSGSNVSDSGSFTYLDHTQKLKRNHVQNFMFSHVATQTETET